jgi:hypothetical protein
MEIRKTLLAALLLGGVTAMPAFADTLGCPTSRKTEAEGGAGGNWQPTPGAAKQKTEAEGGAGGNWQVTPGAVAQKTEAEGGAGGNWQLAPGAGAQKTAAAAGSQQAAAMPCR